MSARTAAGSDPSRPAAGRRCVWRVGRLLFRAVCGLVLLAVLLWGVLAVYYSNLPRWLCPLAAAGVAVVSLTSVIGIRPRWRGLAGFVLLFLFIAAWWSLIPPSNQRDWQADVAVLPWAELDGNRVTVHDIRNCNYRSQTDYDPRWYDRTFDLGKLQSVDLIFSQWGSPHIAHTMFSFGFGDDEYLCFSIETRKRKGQSYSTIQGFFKQYELTYVVADERDVVRLRTNYRGEQVYLYRLHSSPALMRSVFLDYLRAVNSLHDRPQWYNALTSNCTTNIRGHTQPFRQGDWDWRILANGHLVEMLYERGVVDTRLPWPQLMQRSRINERALAAGQADDFSRRIRLGLPGVWPSALPGTTAKE